MNRESGHFRPGDTIRVVAALAVVLLHAASGQVLRIGSIPDYDWWAANILDSGSRWCVPVFVMLSGALLLDPSREDSLGTFYRKRLWRIGIPLIAWSAFFALWSTWIHESPLTVRRVAGTLLTRGTYHHMYFLYVLVGLYLFVPFLRVFVKSCDRRNLGSAAFLCLLTAMIGVSITKALGGAVPNAALTFVPYVGYFLAGYYFRTSTVSRRRAMAAGVGFLATVAITAILTGTLAFQYGISKGSSIGALFFYDHFSPTGIPMTLCAFTILSYEPLACSRMPAPVVRVIAPCTFGIYLIHPIVLDLIGYREANWQWPIAAMLFWAVACFAICFVATWLLRKLPGVRWIVGG